MMTRQVTTEIIQPSAVLRPYVHHYCLIKTYRRGISPIIMPTGCMKWIFHRKQPFRVNGETGLTACASICGPYDKAIHLDTQEELEMIMAFFIPMRSTCSRKCPANSSPMGMSISTAWKTMISRHSKVVCSKQIALRQVLLISNRSCSVNCFGIIILPISNRWSRFFKLSNKTKMSGWRHWLKPLVSANGSFDVCLSNT